VSVPERRTGGRDRGYFVWRRSPLDAYLDAHELGGPDAGLFVRMILAADARTGRLDGDLDAWAEYLGISQRTFRRLLDRLDDEHPDAAGVVRVERSNAPGRGEIVILNYAELNPRSPLAAGPSADTSTDRLSESADTSTDTSADTSADRLSGLSAPETAVSPGESGQIVRTLYQEDQENQENDDQELVEEDARALTSPAANGAELPEAEEIPSLVERFARRITTRRERLEPDEIEDTVARLATLYGTEAVSAWEALLNPAYRWKYPREAEERARAEIPTLGLPGQHRTAEVADVWNGPRSSS
jgi:hypothetical protein